MQCKLDTSIDVLRHVVLLEAKVGENRIGYLTYRVGYGFDSRPPRTVSLV